MPSSLPVKLGRQRWPSLTAFYKHLEKTFGVTVKACATRYYRGDSPRQIAAWASKAPTAKRRAARVTPETRRVVHPLAAWRERHGLSMKNFGAMVMASTTAISRIEHGQMRPSPELVSRIARATGGEVVLPRHRVRRLSGAGDADQ